MQIEYELVLIKQKNYVFYFFIVQDIVCFVCSQDIFCQGCGLVVNLVVCFVLGVIEIDLVCSNLLFECFIFVECDELLDIDIDFEYECCEEVLQYVFKCYGCECVVLIVVVISYCGCSVICDVVCVLGLLMDQVNELGVVMDYWGGNILLLEILCECGFDLDMLLMWCLLVFIVELIDFLCYLLQYLGGFVIFEYLLLILVLVENVVMVDCIVIQWDKDDLDVIGLMKVDCLVLGMFMVICKCLVMLKQYGLYEGCMDVILFKDVKIFDMICVVDIIGVFQIELCVQMVMLLCMQLCMFYDLVIEVVIVCFGLIQGDMVYFYLEWWWILCEQGLEVLNDLDNLFYLLQLECVFVCMLGVLLFQEQVMQLVVEVVGYMFGQVDVLCCLMVVWKCCGGLELYCEKLLVGMLENGFSCEYGEYLFEQIKGFGDYGFLESYVVSFVLLIYNSCWLKCYYLVVFIVSLINSQLLGFYSFDQLLQDVWWYGIIVFFVDVCYSDWDCMLDFSRGLVVICLGLCLIDGCNEGVVQVIMCECVWCLFDDVGDLCQCIVLDCCQQGLLVDVGVLCGFSGYCYCVCWDILGVENWLLLFDQVCVIVEVCVLLLLFSVWEDMQVDYCSMGIIFGCYLILFLCVQLCSCGCLDVVQLVGYGYGCCVCIVGLVCMCQWLQIVSGVIFFIFEDEIGMVNVVVWCYLVDCQYWVLVDIQLMQIDGCLECVDGVQYVIVQCMYCLDELLQGLCSYSCDFY